MADNQAEQKQQAAQEEKKAKPTGLEALVKEGSQLGNLALAASAVGASAGASYFLGGLDAAVNSALITASFPLGRIVVNYLAGKPITDKIIRNEAFAGLFFTSAVLGGIKAIQAAPKHFGLEGVVTNILGYSMPAAPLLVAGLNFAVLTPALTALFYPLTNLFQGKRMFQDFGKNYLRGLAWTLPVNLFASGVLAASYAGVPFIAPYLFPAIALANIGYYIFASPDIRYMKKLFAPVLAPYYLVKGAYYLASGAVGATVGLGKGLVNLVSNLYKGVHDVALSFNRAMGVAAPVTK